MVAISFMPLIENTRPYVVATDRVTPHLIFRPVGLAIEPTWMIRYPMPLVFYAHPEQPELANRISEGLGIIQASGKLEDIFNTHYGAIAGRLSLERRTVIILSNPMLGDWRIE